VTVFQHGRLVLLAAALGVAATASVAPASGQSRRPENSPWIATPSSEELIACSPEGAALPKGRAVAMCRVGPRGKLEDCTFDRVVGGAPMRAWAACAIAGFTARSELRGRTVEVPVEPIGEIVQTPIPG